ncbi:MAG: N-acetyl-gamma-glutamyl-phosphate reductase [Bryobacteraceae bacterium]|nr:N-acetyl-gamma-glutamyl-phosphate reductase [Bryobacteraceae bacterium]
MSTLTGIVGFRGYSGAELIRLLSAHPYARPVLLEHRADSGDRPLPLGHDGPPRLAATPEAARDAGLACIFLATPHEVSIELAPAFLAAGLRVIDLSGAFRLRTPDVYARWYKEPAIPADLLASAVYGLPEFYRENIRGARFVSNPGCYPTAANLALRPLVQAGVLDLGAGIVCDAKSGVSGAGRKPSLKTHFCEVTGNFSAYSILQHRHVPEVLQNSGLEESQFSFAAQLIPVHRGILETIYVRLNQDADLHQIYADAYANEPFVRRYAPGQVPDLAAVNGTNFCDLGIVQQGRRAVIVAAEDNLVKGAAGQAVQNLNLMFGWPETAGLL